MNKHTAVLLTSLRKSHDKQTHRGRISNIPAVKEVNGSFCYLFHIYIYTPTCFRIRVNGKVFDMISFDIPHNLQYGNALQCSTYGAQIIPPSCGPEDFINFLTYERSSAVVGAIKMSRRFPQLYRKTVAALA